MEYPRERACEVDSYSDGGEAIVTALRQLGVEYIISSPGSEWSPVWEALNRQRANGIAGPSYIQCWHEMLATSVAIGFTMVTGRMQAVLLHAATGILHGALGLRAATRAELPMLVLSGESNSLGEDPELVMEGQWYAGVSVGGSDRLTSPLVKWSGRVHSAVTLYRSTVRAGQMASHLPKGVVHLDVPLEYMLSNWRSPNDLDPVPSSARLTSAPADIDRLARALINASNPIIVAEHAAANPDAFGALQSLAEILAIPVIGAPGATCANFPYDHPLWMGVGAYEHLAAADILLLVGGRTPWYPPSRRVTKGRIIAIGDYPHTECLSYQNLQANEYVEGDIAVTLNAVVGRVREIGFSQEIVSQRSAMWSQAHEELNARLQTERYSALSDSSLNILSICEIIRSLAAPNTVYVEETVTHSVALRQNLPLNEAQSFFRLHAGSGLGQGLGVSLGIKLAKRNQPVVFFVGDGSFLYNPITQAFGLSRDYGLPILIIVLNNGSYASMGGGHRLYYPNGVKTNSETQFGVSINPPAFEELGRQFGYYGAAASTPQEMTLAFKEAMAAVETGKTAIINANVTDTGSG